MADCGRAIGHLLRPQHSHTDTHTFTHSHTDVAPVGFLEFRIDDRSGHVRSIPAQLGPNFSVRRGVLPSFTRFFNFHQAFPWIYWLEELI